MTATLLLIKATWPNSEHVVIKSTGTTGYPAIREGKSLKKRLNQAIYLPWVDNNYNKKNRQRKKSSKPEHSTEHLAARGVVPPSL